MTTETLSHTPVASEASEHAANAELTLQRLLRVAVAMCFIGHGAWGVITKAGWLPFYAVFGIPESIAWKTMPLIGTMDITIGIVALLFPFRALFVYATFWTVFTALLRPLAGMGIWEFLERAGNYGPPLALALIAHQATRDAWFERLTVQPLSRELLQRLDLILRGSIALLLIGHAGFELVQAKPQLLAHWRAIGIPADVSFLHWIGAAELALALAVLARPTRGLLLTIAAWKVATELLYPITGQLRDGFEWLERGGDYVAPLALMVVASLRASSSALKTGDPARKLA